MALLSRLISPRHVLRYNVQRPQMRESTLQMKMNSVLPPSYLSTIFTIKTGKIASKHVTPDSAVHDKNGESPLTNIDDRPAKTRR